MQWKALDVPQTIDLLEDGEIRVYQVRAVFDGLELRGTLIKNAIAYPAKVTVELETCISNNGTAEEILEEAKNLWLRWKIEPEAVYEYWRHVSSGEVYAVQVYAGKVIAAVGPLTCRELTENRPDDYNFNRLDAVEDGEWVETRKEEFALYE